MDQTRRNVDDWIIENRQLFSGVHSTIANVVIYIQFYRRQAYTTKGDDDTHDVRNTCCPLPRWSRFPFALPHFLDFHACVVLSAVTFAQENHPLTNIPNPGDVQTSYILPDHPSKQFPAGEQVTQEHASHSLHSGLCSV